MAIEGFLEGKIPHITLSSNQKVEYLLKISPGKGKAFSQTLSNAQMCIQQTANITSPSVVFLYSKSNEIQFYLSLNTIYNLQ